MKEQGFRRNTMKTFMVIWFGQFISMLGSALSAFGLGIWIFQKTGNAASFAMSAVCTVLPALLFAPLTGSIADRPLSSSPIQYHSISTVLFIHIRLNIPQFTVVFIAK